MVPKQRRAPSKQRESALRRNEEVRRHYRRRRVPTQDGRWYNPLLDDPTHPDNIRGWTHGTPEGYRDAGCTGCEPCAAAGRAEAKRKEEVRLATRLENHRGRVAEILTARYPSLPTVDITNGAEAVVAAHRVRQKFRAILAYEQVPVEYALNNWVLASRLDIDVNDIPDLADAITKELNP